jgi:hypothetical protein
VAKFQKGCPKIATSGRRAGTLNKNTAEVKALANKSAPQAIKKLVYLIEHGESEAVQVAACKELLDRAIGKAVQPHAGEGGHGPMIIEVHTGVPRAEVF